MSNQKIHFINRIPLLLLTMASLVCVTACTTEPTNNSNTPGASPSPTASASPAANISSMPVTLPVLDALFSDETFKTRLKAKVELSDDQIAQLQKIAADEVAKLRESNTEDQTIEQSRQAEEIRRKAGEAIRGVVGEKKADEVFAFVRDYWVKGSEEVAAGATEDAMLPGPNAVPKDTRVVVNIPAYRMDVFQDGSLLKSYKIGIGYPDFPLPTGLRKAQSIIFNPTWTPPDEPWVAKMKNVSVGEKVEAGSKLNPLGPIKIPIGLPSLIHGGKSAAKLGTFASHGCVGLTSLQVQDFSKLLAQASGTELSDKTIQAHLKDKTQTKSVKLSKVVPVELRYETIVVEDGKLHIYKDVYDQDSNTEANLRAVLQANGVNFDELPETDRNQILDALNAMSRRPTKAVATKTEPSPASTFSVVNSPEKKAATAKAKKPIGKNQKEVVIELAALSGKGYPAAVNLDTGTGKPTPAATALAAKSGT